MGLVEQMFGVASATAYIRAGGSGDYSRQILASLAKGFGGKTGDGAYVHDIFAAQGNFSNSGFDGSSAYYATLEQNLTSFSGPYKIGAAAIIYSYLNYPNNSEELIVQYINSFCSSLDEFYHTPQPSYTVSGLRYAVGAASLTSINANISSIPQNTIKKAVNYNWYDSSPLFVNPDFNSMATLIRDVECQYYYVSGELLYSSLPNRSNDCVSYYVDVNTSEGVKSIKVYQNTPCVEKDTYVGPISGIKFFRTFVDGPYTSGYFTKDVMEDYYNFEKALLSNGDYSSNLVSSYSVKKDASGAYIPLMRNTRLDVPGYVQSGREYGYGHTNFVDEGCAEHPDWPLQNMHQGNDARKLYLHSWRGVFPDTTCYQETGYYDWTGWKLAVFELDKSLASRYKKIKLNPHNETGGILRRILNLDNYADELGNPVTPYLNVVDTGDGSLTCGDLSYWGGPIYVGPPQLNGNSSLPGFAFYQEFNNYNFPSGGKKFSFHLRPMITSNETSFEVSNYDVVTGEAAAIYSSVTSKPTYSIQTNVSSNSISGKDDIYKKCFGMGDNFGGGVSSISGLQSNAGFVYTGFSYSSGGKSISIGDFLTNNSTKIGDKYSKIKYPYAYLSGSHVISVRNQKGFFVTGDTSSGIFAKGESMNYEYFKDGVFGATNTGWNSVFAPAPEELVSNYYSLYPQYYEQDVENYLPRYIRGPYLTYETKFLYPNAQSTFNVYQSNVNGFPTNVEYVISVKEETVREGFKVIRLNGSSLNRHVVRADSLGNNLMLETLMANPFVPNDSTYSYKYDFTRNSSLYPNDGAFFHQSYFDSELVDENYVPSTSGCPQDGINSTIYSSNSELFNQGVKITGKLVTRQIFTGVGKTKGVSYVEPVGGGVYWGYKGKKITGSMTYSSPVFDLSTYSINPSTDLTASMTNSIYGSTTPTCSNNGDLVDGGLYDYSSSGTYGYNGKDPIFYKYVGGRIGSGSSGEGGYHISGIIGDQWYHFNAENWGNSLAYCGENRYFFRYPPSDSYASLCVLTSGGLNFFVRGLSYYPYYLNWKYNPFTSAGSIGSIGVTTTSKEATKLNYYFDFNLKDAFYPLQSGLTGAGYSGLYLESGLNVGPFDRDVELCVTGKGIFPRGTWLIDGEVISAPDRFDCPHPLKGIELNSGVALGEHGRYGLITTFKLIPSGSVININISGTGLIGVTGNSMITIRPRNCVGAVSTNYGDVTTYSGDAGFLDGLRYINNGSENKFSFSVSNNDFGSLVGKTFSATTVSNQQILYPKPPADDFDVVLKPTLDAFGNKKYKSNPTKEYWKVRGYDNLYSGFREVTRIYMHVDSINVKMGEIPYQTYRTVVPSGLCAISGSFGYSGQAESAVVSDGIFVTGLSGANALSGIFEPIYISDVLQRLPTGIYALPSGSGSKPVLLAPSYMKQRRNPYVISGNDVYIPVSYDAEKHYNAFLWPAWSDLALLNPEVVYESIPPYDGNVYPDSYLTFSASQGQPIGTGFNPIENVTYAVVAQYGFLDSVATNPLYNTGKCVFSGNAAKTQINSGDLSGILLPEGVSLTMAINANNFKK